MASVYVIHAYAPPDGPSNFPLSLQLDDHWWHIPPNEPTEIESVFYAEKLIEIYGPVYGIVPVSTVKTRTGTHIDIEAAEQHARESLQRVEESLLLLWVREQQETRLRNNLPALPPSGRVAEIIATHKIDVKKKFNLDIAGSAVLVDEDKTRLEKENADLRAQLAANSKNLDTILSRIQSLESAATQPSGKK